MPRSSRRVALRCLLFLAAFGVVCPRAFAQDHKKAAKKHSAAPAGGKHVKGPEDVPAPTDIETKHAAQEPAQPETMQTRGPTRLDFDDRTVQGQGSKVGAVYLYDRKNLPLRSMVRKRENFRDQIGSDEVSGPVVE
jgi:hypothetical protein